MYCIPNISTHTYSLQCCAVLRHSHEGVKEPKIVRTATSTRSILSDTSVEAPLALALRPFSEIAIQ